MNVGEKILSTNQKEIGCRDILPNELMLYLSYNRPIFYSWGAHNFKYFTDSKIFRMTVNGFKHKGYVFITLNFLDLFDVYYTQKNGTIVAIDKDIYNDQLMNIIDERIEKIPLYDKSSLN